MNSVRDVIHDAGGVSVVALAVQLNKRSTKSPEATFPLIHGNEFGQYDIQGTALSVIENEADPTLGYFGHLVTIPTAA